MVWLLLEMLLALSRHQTYPAKPSPALRALDLRAASTYHGNSGSTLDIWTSLGAVLDVKFV